MVAERSKAASSEVARSTLGRTVVLEVAALSAPSWVDEVLEVESWSEEEVDDCSDERCLRWGLWERGGMVECLNGGGSFGICLLGMGVGRNFLGFGTERADDVARALVPLDFEAFVGEGRDDA